MKPPLICSLCTNIAHRYVGKRGFCESHTSEAFDAAKREVRAMDAKNYDIVSESRLRRLKRDLFNPLIENTI